MSETVDPGVVPRRTLVSGAEMPAIGFGTFGSDHTPPAMVAEAVRGALEGGYRHLDCASVYGNEREIGSVLRDARSRDLRREELWVTSKVWNDRHDDVAGSCEQSLAHLGLDELDMYLVHWPFPNFHPPGCDVTSRSPDARPYVHERYMETWRQMERLVERGLARHIGTSNMTVPKLRLLLRDASIPPAVNEMELHPHFQQPELFEFVRAHGIEPVGYCPLGSPHRPDRDRTPEDTDPLQDPLVVEIARAHDVHPAAVCLKWAVQRGQTPIPMSTRRRNYLANLRAVVEDLLTDDEMERLAGIDRNCRMIKGQVFLWKESQSWEDLWDVHGEITPP
jgi:alcohol dehydrogenase (NADP+)